jgi:hypothetical protein
LFAQPPGAIFWLVLVILYFHERVEQEGDPSYSNEADMRKYVDLYAVGAFILSAYLLYLLMLTVFCLRNVCAMPAKSKFLFFLTLIVILITIIGIYANFLSPLAHSSMTFIVFHWVYNAYIAIMCFCFTPTEGSVRDTQQQRMDHLVSTELFRNVENAPLDSHSDSHFNSQSPPQHGADLGNSGHGGGSRDGYSSRRDGGEVALEVRGGRRDQEEEEEEEVEVDFGDVQEVAVAGGPGGGGDEDLVQVDSI